MDLEMGWYLSSHCVGNTTCSNYTHSSSLMALKTREPKMHKGISSWLMEFTYQFPEPTRATLFFSAISNPINPAQFIHVTNLLLSDKLKTPTYDIHVACSSSIIMYSAECIQIFKVKSSLATIRSSTPPCSKQLDACLNGTSYSCLGLVNEKKGVATT